MRLTERTRISSSDNNKIGQSEAYFDSEENKALTLDEEKNKAKKTFKKIMKIIEVDARIKISLK